MKVSVLGRCVGVCVAICAAALMAPPAGANTREDSRPVVVAPLEGVRLSGEGWLRFLGLDIYRARLWVSPGFDPRDFAALPLALELEYQRNFRAEAIAQRSIQEMRRLGRVSDEQAQQWQQALRTALPDVKSGDRLTGVLLPQRGVRFLSGGRIHGEVGDPEFARLFFAIWLSPSTPEPELRRSLLGDLAGR